MSRNNIGPVRPFFNIEENVSNKTERLIAGSKSAGMVIDVTKEGLEINAYYTGSGEDLIKYANLRKPVIIPWKELDKIKKNINNAGTDTAYLDRKDETVDDKYLKSLPIITINGAKYYVDSVKRERRDVNNPKSVWKF